MDTTTHLPLIGYATVDSLHHTISIGQFHDSDKYSNLLQLLEILPLSAVSPSQLTPSTASPSGSAPAAGYGLFVGLDRIRIHQPAADKLFAVLQRRLKELCVGSGSSYVEPVECKYSGFKREQADIEAELDRLVINQAAVQSAKRETAAIAAAGAAISSTNLLADQPNIGKWRLEQLRLDDIMLLDSNAATSLNLFPQPGDSDRHASLFGLLDKGRCFSRGTRLRLYDGDTIAVESVRGGEQLMGDDGRPRTVTPGSLVQGNDTLYRITPTWKGAKPFTVNGDHILVLINNLKPYYVERSDARGTYRVHWNELGTDGIMRLRSKNVMGLDDAQANVDSLMGDWQPLEWEVSVEDFRASQSLVRSHCKLIASKAITFNNPQLPSLHDVLTVAQDGVAPTAAQVQWMAWWLGMWLTDGCSDRARISQGGEDPPHPHHHHEIFHRLKFGFALAFYDDAEQVDDKRSSAGWMVYWFTYYDTVCDRVLRAYGLLNNKHVPRALICDSLDVRRWLLAGLIDGDGYYDRQNNMYEIQAKHRAVIHSYKELAATLGLRNSAVQPHDCTNQQTGEVYRGNRIHITGDMWDAVQYCAATYKQCPQPGSVDYVEKNRDSRCYGFSIVERPAGNYFGFTVDGNQRFLLEDYTVTHNTSMSSRLLRQRIKQPSMSLPEIERRQRLLAIFVSSLPLREHVADKLRRFSDMNKLVNRFQKGKASLQHLVHVWQCIEKGEEVLHELKQYEGEGHDELEKEFIQPMHAVMGPCMTLRQMVVDTIDMGQLRGYKYAVKPELDAELNAANMEVKQCERDMGREATRVERQYGLDEDSVGVVDKLAESKGHLLRVSRKTEQQLRGVTGITEVQSNKQGYFFTTKRMRELSEQMKEAQREVDQREKQLEAEALQIAAEYMPSFEQFGVLITELDLLIGFAHVCVNAPVPYVRPTVLGKEAGVLELKGSRHPCMEVLDGMMFIPNDVSMKRGTSHMQIITGPNMCQNTRAM